MSGFTGRRLAGREFITAMIAPAYKHQLSAKNFALLGMCLGAQTAALFFVKYGLYVKAPYILTPFLTKYWLLGLLFIALQAVFWQKLLSAVDLSLAYAASSIFIVLNLIVCRLAFAETITLQHFAGGVLLCVGVTIIVFSKKTPESAGR
jgi:drug/metabolite transporter (DMT)-like permease